MASPALNNRLKVSNLTCIRGERVLFKKLSFTLNSGKLLYVQGENGSGKTTLLRTLCGLSMPAAGDVLWNDLNTNSLTQDYFGQVLYVGHLASIKGDLSAVENIQFSLSLTGYTVEREQVVAALDTLGVARCADLPSRVLSQGQKRRIALTQLWLQDSPALIPLWILDEPFTALDTNMIKKLEQHIEKYIKNDGMVIFTSHQRPNFKSDLMQNLLLGDA